MAEPLRKRKTTKRGGATGIDRYVESRGLLLATSNLKNPGVLDLKEFEVGTENEPRSNWKWNGGFSGRPALIHQLAPAIHALYSTRGAISLPQLRITLRVFFRLFDKYHAEAPVQTLADINDVHGGLQFREQINGGTTTAFLQIVNVARENHKLVPLYWPKHARRTPVVPVSNEQDFRWLRHELRHEVLRIIDRWDRADLLSLEGEDRSGRKATSTDRQWTEADIHATYRGLARTLGIPCPSQQVCVKYLGLGYGVKCFRKAIDGMYPNRRDSQTFLMLLMLSTGWNGATVMAIDASSVDSCIKPHPLTAGYSILFSIKGRGNSLQEATDRPFGESEETDIYQDDDFSDGASVSSVGATKSLMTAPQLIKMLIWRTQPLQDHLRLQLQHLESASEPDERLIAQIKRRIRSPWRFVASRDHNAVKDLGPVHYLSDGTDDINAILRLVQRANAKRSPSEQIDEKMTGRVLRRGWILLSLSLHGYSFVVCQLFAGHATLGSLKAYLRTLRLRLYSDRKVIQLGNNLWIKLAARQPIDLVELRVLVRQGFITPEQAERWADGKDRTRCGTGCLDIQNPPAYIEPDHLEGEKCGTQRCGICQHAVLFRSGLNLLARRHAELEIQRAETSLELWASSTYADEIEILAELFRLHFNPYEVAEQLEFWHEEMKTGRHKLRRN